MFNSLCFFLLEFEMRGRVSVIFLLSPLTTAVPRPGIVLLNVTYRYNNRKMHSIGELLKKSFDLLLGYLRWIVF
jgi:hypothetical protein